MKNIVSVSMILMLLFVMAAAGCGGSSPSGLAVSISGEERNIEVTSSGTYSSTKTFTETRDGQSNITKAASHYIVLGNYEIDTSSGMVSMGKPVTSDAQMRVAIQIVGEEGTDNKAAIEPGTYTTAADKFNKLDYVNVATFADGKESKTSFNISKSEGEVKITSVTDHEVAGEILITEGEKSIKGSFRAKITSRKK